MAQLLRTSNCGSESTIPLRHKFVSKLAVGILANRSRVMSSSLAGRTLVISPTRPKNTDRHGSVPDTMEQLHNYGYRSGQCGWQIWYAQSNGGQRTCWKERACWSSLAPGSHNVAKWRP
eukprot:2274524-Amphidinium_carterae.1